MSTLTAILVFAAVLTGRYFDVTAGTAFMLGAGSVWIGWLASILVR